MHEMFDLTGKIAVVTGCASEMGKQMAEALAEANADIVGIDKSSLAGVESAVKGYGKNFYGIRADLSNTDIIPDIVQGIVDKLGHIDILIDYSNAQDSGQQPENICWDEYLHIIDVNQNAVVRMAILVYSQMLKQSSGGKIVIVSSVLADRTSPDALAYTISKNAVVGLMRTLSIAGAQHKIWVNAIAPGMIETAAIQGLSKELYDQLNTKVIQGGLAAQKLGKPENIRGTVVFLSSKASDYTVGQIFRIDGGFTSRI